jgi:hypothetical protein
MASKTGCGDYAILVNQMEAAARVIEALATAARLHLSGTALETGASLFENLR